MKKHPNIKRNTKQVRKGKRSCADHHPKAMKRKLSSKGTLISARRDTRGRACGRSCTDIQDAPKIILHLLGLHGPGRRRRMCRHVERRFCILRLGRSKVWLLHVRIRHVIPIGRWRRPSMGVRIGGDLAPQRRVGITELLRAVGVRV